MEENLIPISHLSVGDEFGFGNGRWKVIAIEGRQVQCEKLPDRMYLPFEQKILID